VQSTAFRGHSGLQLIGDKGLMPDEKSGIECPIISCPCWLRELLAVLSRITTQGRVMKAYFANLPSAVWYWFSAGVGCNALRVGDRRAPSDPRGRAGSGAHGSADY